MSLKKLLDLIVMRKLETSDEKLSRNKDTARRLAQWDKECAERVRRSVPTQEQLNRKLDWHTRND